MASKFDRKKIIWTITNFTKLVASKYNRNGSVFTDWIEIAVDGKIDKCRFEFRPNILNSCYIDLQFENSADILSRINLSFQLSDYTVKHESCLISHEKLFEKSKKFINNDTLTIIMDILFFEVYYQHDDENEFNKADAQYFNSSTFSDFKIICRDNVEIPAHRFVLTRSSVFKAMLNSNMIESTTAQVKIKDIDGAVMLEVLRYLYTGKVENRFEHSSQIIYAANKYDLERLKEMCVDYLTEEMSVTNVIDTLIIADETNEEYLAELCLSLIKKCYNELRTSDDWKKLSMDLKDRIMDTLQTTTVTFNTRLDG